MKTQNILLALAILITSMSFGQITTDPVTGYVGIGTPTPRANFDMANYISNGQLGTVFGRLPEGDEVGLGTYLGVKGFTTQGTDFSNVKSFSIVHDFYGQTNNSINFYRGGSILGGFMTFNTNDNTEKLRITANGNVGIGTTTPDEKLTVGGNILASTSLYFQDNSKFTVTNASVPSLTLTPFSMPLYGIAAPNTAGSADLWISGHNAIRMFTGGNPNPTVNILSGKVGIGSLNPDEMLTVKGKIHAEEIIVDLAVPADYVFQKYYTGKSELKSDYVMPTLAEIENFTKKNNHLPGVPSAQEVQQNGLSLGEMSNVLLQKVEELTLYAIEQNKEIERLKKENEQYKSLAERISALEKK